MIVTVASDDCAQTDAHVIQRCFGNAGSDRDTCSRDVRVASQAGLTRFLNSDDTADRFSQSVYDSAVAQAEAVVETRLRPTKMGRYSLQYDIKRGRPAVPTSEDRL